MIPGPVDFSDSMDFSEDNKLQEQLESRYLRLSEYLMTERELLQSKYHEDVMLLENAYVEGIIPTQEALDQQLEDLALLHEERLSNIKHDGVKAREKFEQMSTKNQIKTVVGGLAQMTSGVAHHSKRMFKLNKAAGIANALVSTHEGVAKALAAYPPPISFVMAAGQLVAGMARVNAIKSQSFGGGSSSPGTVGGSPIPPSDIGRNTSSGVLNNALQRAQARIVTINFGDAALLPKEAVRNLVEQINEEVGDGLILETT